MLLRQVDRWLGFTKQLDRILPDRRNPLLIQHSQESLLRQRIYGLALGYEDLNDHDSLRHDLLWQTATDRTSELGSCSTLCRLENRAGRKEAWLIHQVLFEQFVESFSAPPKELILDFDCTDDRVHGMQVGRAFQGYYYDYCFLPLYVFCGEQLLTCPPVKFASIFLRPKPGNSNPSWLSSSTSEAFCLVGIKHLNHSRLLKRLRYFSAQNDEKLGQVGTHALRSLFAA
jgi:hypothetical protein